MFSAVLFPILFLDTFPFHLIPLHFSIFPFSYLSTDPSQARLGCIDGYGCASVTPISTPKSIVIPPAHGISLLNNSNNAEMGYETGIS